MLTRRDLLSASAALPLAATATRVLATPVPPSVEEFMRDPSIKDVALSLKGDRIALLGAAPAQAGARSAYVLFVNSQNVEKPLRRVNLGDVKADWIDWANDERVLLSLTLERQGATAAVTGGRLGERGKKPIKAARVVSLGLDNAPPALMFENRRRSLGGNRNLSQIADHTWDDPEHVMMPAWGAERLGLYKVNVLTGAAALVEEGGDRTFGWNTQDGVPVLRYDLNWLGNGVNVLARAPGEREWQKVTELHREDMNGWRFAAWTKEPGVLLVSQRGEGEETRTIRRYDLRTKTMGEVVAGRPDRDVSAPLGTKRGQYLGATFVNDVVEHSFADPALAPHFRALQKFVGPDNNIRIHDISDDSRRLILRVSGPREAGAFYFYDLGARDLVPLGQSKPWLSEDRLAKVEVLKVRTRDGAEIPAYLTVPIGTAKGPRPMVVMPHGGPEARDSLEFDVWAQALAARGWLVLQPNFRGSDGYGRKFAEAGYRQWGRRMQDDVEDAVDQVVAAGRADPARLAVLGWSYGGYAALTVAGLKPDRYKAVVAGAAPTDLLEMLGYERREAGRDSEVFKYWVKHIGDPGRDRDAIQAVSPRRLAGAITAPVLLLHGEGDEVVPVEQSRRMVKALQNAGRKPEYLEIEDAGHGGWEAEDEQRFLEAAVSFLGRRLA
jgi:pimeloyl-ACP methyl ester carboxylesterase